jgi:hypothetical protein
VSRKLSIIISVLSGWPMAFSSTRSLMARTSSCVSSFSPVPRPQPTMASTVRIHIIMVYLIALIVEYSFKMMQRYAIFLNDSTFPPVFFYQELERFVEVFRKAQGNSSVSAKKRMISFCFALDFS